MIMGKAMIVVMGVVVFGGMAAMMTAMMASGVMGPGMMRGWRGSSDPQTPVASQSDQFTVEIRDFTFRPNDLTVKAGTRVTWVNRDGVPHDATDIDGAWNTERLNKNDEDNVTFDTPGVYPYRCTIHPQMKGTVTVQ